MRQIFKILTCFLASIGVCTAILVCFILIYPVFYGDFGSQREEKGPPDTAAAITESDEPDLAEAVPVTDPLADLPSPVAASPAAPTPVTASPAPQAKSSDRPSPAETPTPTPTPKEEEIPAEYQSALNRADNYCDLMHMSKDAIYDQLTSEYGENVSPEAARYAVNHVNADWEANALQKAKVYSDTMYMSQTAIYDQLISENGEKFTQAQARYALDHLEADWNANALHKAKEYRESTNMTNSAIYNQLISENGDKFSPEEASYAIKNLK